MEACVLLTERCLELKRNKEAVGYAEKAAAALPENAGLQSLLGRALGARIGELAFLQQGFVAPRMLRAFKRSVELDPHHVPGLFGLANYYLYSPAIAGGDAGKADEYAARAEALAPYDGAILRAQIRERQEQWADAAECYERALRLQPSNPWLHAQVGAARLKAGERGRARAAFETVLALQPDHAEAKAALEALAVSIGSSDE